MMTSGRGRCPINGINRGFSDSQRSNFRHVEVPVKVTREQNLRLNPGWGNIDDLGKSTANENTPVKYSANAPVKEAPKNCDNNLVDNKKVDVDWSACVGCKPHTLVVPSSPIGVWSFRKSEPRPSQIHEERIANAKDVSKEISKQQFDSNLMKQANVSNHENACSAGNQVSQPLTSTQLSELLVDPVIDATNEDLLISASSQNNVNLTAPPTLYVRRPFGGGCGNNIVPINEVDPEYLKKCIEANDFVTDPRMLVPFRNLPRFQPFDEPFRPVRKSSDSGFVSELLREANLYSHASQRPFEVEKQDVGNVDKTYDDFGRLKNDDFIPTKENVFGPAKNNDFGLVKDNVFGPDVSHCGFAKSLPVVFNDAGITSKCLDAAQKTSIFNEYHFPNSSYPGAAIRHTIEVIVGEKKADSNQKQELADSFTDGIVLESAAPVLNNSISTVPVIVSETDVFGDLQFSQCERLANIMSNIQISAKQPMNNFEKPELELKVFAAFDEILTPKSSCTKVNENGNLSSWAGLSKDDLREFAKISQKFYDSLGEMNAFIQRLCLR